MNIQKTLNTINPFKILGQLIDLENTLENYFLYGGVGSVGLDLGTFGAKVVQLNETSRGLELIKCGYKEIPRSYHDQAVSLDESSVIQTIRELWEEHKIDAKRVNLTISDASLYSRQIQIPKVRDEQLNKAIKQQAEKYIPFSIDEAVVDYQLIETDAKNNDQIEVFIIAAKKEMIHKYLSILREARLTANIADVSFFSTAKAIMKYYANDNNKVLPIIDIGAQATTVMIFCGKSLRFVRNFECAGNHFTKALATGLNLSEEEAEKIKRKSSLYPQEGKASADLQSINVHLETVLEEFLGQLQRCFAYCERDLPVDNIEQIVMSGGGAKLKGLARYLSENAGINTVVADPICRLIVAPSLMDQSILKEQAPLLSAALGAALRPGVKARQS